MRRVFCFLASAAWLVFADAAQADVVISVAATQNMSCSRGVCSPTAASAVLNAGDLENMLAAGGVTVTTTGNGIQANNILVGAPFGWSATNTLSLEAYQSITIDKPLSVEGQGGLSLATNDGGSGGHLSFGHKGHATFEDVSSQLTINGLAYTLVNSIQSLASAIASDPAGFFALANRYDAKADGTYSSSPIQTNFTGTFEGLGNAISHLSIASRSAGYIGLFTSVSGTIENLHVLHADLRVVDGSFTGILSSLINGTISRVTVTGNIHGTGSRGNEIGGLGAEAGTLVQCYADVRIVDDESEGEAGGLVSHFGGSIDESFATGSIAVAGRYHTVGGLAGSNAGVIRNSYSTVTVASGVHSVVGGFIGVDGVDENGGSTEASYSTGAVSGGKQSKIGGFIGAVKPHHDFRQSYWDTDTSGTDQAVGKGRGNGITGLTTEQLQSGLPDGFDPAIWAQNRKINNGFPYLINNPPPGK